jgi:SAM-dependent methyltransferase
MNLRNPHDHEISFDRNVWLPTKRQKYRGLAELLDDRQLISQLLSQHLDIITEFRPHDPIASARLLERLSEEEIAEVKEQLRRLQQDPAPHKLIVAGSYLSEEIREKLGTSINNPPADIHRMQQDDQYVGDLYSADMVASALSRSGLSIDASRKYLDFGCSSGSLIRILKTAFADSEFHGVDPLPSSIAWAAENIPGATFSISNTTPPLAFADQTFHGATAISIWSHLDEQLAIDWFDEMYRVIADDGWLLFTTHGDTSLAFCNSRALQPTRRTLALAEGLANSDFVFEEVYVGKSPEGIDATGYGNTYFRKSWVERNLGRQWEVAYFGPAENQQNQDVYVLKKRPGQTRALHDRKRLRTRIKRAIRYLSYLLAKAAE